MSIRFVAAQRCNGKGGVGFRILRDLGNIFQTLNSYGNNASRPHRAEVPSMRCSQGAGGSDFRYGESMNLVAPSVSTHTHVSLVGFKHGLWGVK